MELFWVYDNLCNVETSPRVGRIAWLGKLHESRKPPGTSRTPSVGGSYVFRCAHACGYSTENAYQSNDSLAPDLPDAGL